MEDITFQYKNADDIPDDLLCDICFVPYRQETDVIKPCGDTICKECIDNHIAYNRVETCPRCGRDIESRERCTKQTHRKWLNMIEELPIVCLALDCVWEGQRHMFRDHLRNAHPDAYKALPSSDENVCGDAQSSSDSDMSSIDDFLDDCYDDSSESDAPVATNDNMCAAESSSDAMPAADDDDEDEDEDDFKQYDSPLNDDMVKAMQIASSHYHNETERIIYYDPLRALMSNSKGTLQRDDIPALRNDTEEEIHSRLRRREALEKHNGVYEFFAEKVSNGNPKRHRGQLLRRCNGQVPNKDKDYYHAFSTAEEYHGFMNGRWLIDTGDTVIGTLYSLDGKFPPPLSFFMYDFTSVYPADAYKTVTVSNVGVYEDCVRHRMEWRRVLGGNCGVVSAAPMPWSQYAWMNIVSHMKSRPELCGRDTDDLKLEQHCFSEHYRDAPLSDVFFDVVERNLQTREYDSTRTIALRLLRNVNTYVKYFFHREIEFLSEWYVSLESLLSLKPRALYTLYHVLSPHGDLTTKRAMYRYLFVRERLSRLGCIANVMERSNVETSAVFARIACERDMKVSQLFECTTYRCRWPLPVFGATTFSRIMQGMRIPSRFVRDDAHKRFETAMKLKMKFEEYCNRESGNVALEWRRAVRFRGFKTRADVESAVAELSQNANSLAKLRVGKADDDFVLVEHWRMCYASVLLESLKETITHYMLDRRPARAEQHHECSIDRVYRFPEAHPVSDPARRFPSHKFTLSAEQMRCVRALEYVPMYLTVGGPGTGKTEVMRAIVQCYHPDAVIGVALQNATVRMLASRVTDRVMTLNRLLYWHSITCLWRKIHSEKACTQMFLSTALNPFVADEYKSDPARCHLAEGKYYCKALRTSFTYCVVERTKLVVIDEASMCKTEDVISLLVMFLRCCRHPPKILICGDQCQLPAIECGDLLNDLMKAFDWCSSTFTKNFRFGPSSLTRRNAEAIRLGNYDDIECDLVSHCVETADDDDDGGNDDSYDPEFGSLRRPNKRRRANATRYVPNKDLSSDRMLPPHESHWIDIPEPSHADKGLLRDLLTPVVEYLLKHDRDFSQMNDLGQLPGFQCICPTNALCSVLFEIVERLVFLRQAKARKCRLSHTPRENDTRTRLYERQQVKYGRNIYPIRLCNNLPLFIQRIEVVRVPKRFKESDDEAESTHRAVLEEMGGESDDFATAAGGGGGGGDRQSREAARYGNSESGGGTLTHILREYKAYKKASLHKCDMYPDGTAFSTLCAKPRLPYDSTRTHTVGFRIIADPVTNVLPNGMTRDSSKTVMIPWTSSHIPYLSPATAVTVHSAIGTETDTAFVFMPYFFDKHTTRQLAIVATSRSKKRTVIVSNERTFRQCLKNVDMSRKTFLGDYLRYNLDKHFSGKVPLRRPEDTDEIKRIAESERDEEREAQRMLERLREEQERRRERLRRREEQREKRKSVGIDMSLFNSLSRKRGTPT